MAGFYTAALSKTPALHWPGLSPPCTAVTSATTGVFHGLTISGGGLSCSTSSDVPFTIMKNGNTATSFFFNSVNFGSGCNYNANLNTGAALTVTP